MSSSRSLTYFCFGSVSALCVCVVWAGIMATADAFFLKKLFAHNNNNNNNNRYNRYFYNPMTISVPEVRRQDYSRPEFLEQPYSPSSWFRPMTARLVSPEITTTSTYIPQVNNTREQVLTNVDTTQRERKTNGSMDVLEKIEVEQNSLKPQDSMQPQVTAKPQEPQQSKKKKSSHEERMMNLIKLASYMDPKRCFPRLVCECEFYNTDLEMAPNNIEKRILKLFGVQYGSDRYMKEAVMGQTARKLGNPDPCASTSSTCSDPLVVQLRQRFNSTVPDS